MKAFLLIIFAIPGVALAGTCNLPKGNVDYLESRFFHSEWTGMIQNTVRIEPSSDCSSVRIWDAIPDSNGKVKRPSDQECSSVHGHDFSNVPGLISCTDFKVYKNEAEAVGKPLPYAYIENGALVTRDYGGMMGGLFSNVYLENGRSKGVIAVNSYMRADEVKDMAKYDPELKAMAGKIYVDNGAKDADSVGGVTVPGQNAVASNAGTVQ